MKLTWSQPARRDLLDIIHYYYEIDTDLAAEMSDRISEEPLKLLENPRLGTLTPSQEVRKWRVRKTPFLLFYTVTAEGVEIQRVRHAASDWRKT